MTTKEKLQHARKLIQNKQHDEARALLCTIRHHPLAQEWLSKLDEIQRLKRERELPRRHLPSRV